MCVPSCQACRVIMRSLRNASVVSFGCLCHCGPSYPHHRVSDDHDYTYASVACCICNRHLVSLVQACHLARMPRHTSTQTHTPLSISSQPRIAFPGIAIPCPADWRRFRVRRELVRMPRILGAVHASEPRALSPPRRRGGVDDVARRRARTGTWVHGSHNGSGRVVCRRRVGQWGGRRGRRCTYHVCRQYQCGEPSACKCDVSGRGGARREV